MFFWDEDDADSCDCTILKNYKGAIWGISSPIIAMYLVLVFMGFGNLYRFIQVNSMSKNLALVYIFSILSSFCWVLCFSLVMEPNEYQYPPYATAVYSKILVGIAYQASIFDLKYIVGYYFNVQNKVQTKEDEYAFNKRRNRTELYMIIWFLVILVYYFVDIAVNYVYFYYISNNEKNGKNTPSDDKTPHSQNDTTWFMKATYYFVGVQFLILTVLIIWQTYALILIIRVMGQRLSKEQTRLKRLMVVFAVSYVGSSTYYIC